MKALTDKVYKLERFDGKGGWTYARIPTIKAQKGVPPGWLKVKGSIDGHAFHKLSLMPMGDGKYMLPVRADIRKAIRKKAGDQVHLILYPDFDPLQIPLDLQQCLEDEPAASAFFYSLSESEQSYYAEWVRKAKREETKVTRLAKTIEKLLRKQKFYQQEL